MTLSNANTYTGGTTIRGGHLFVRSQNGSGTGSGVVQVDAGTLAGTGIITGPVTVGTGNGSGALAALAPGDNGVKLGALTILSTLTFDSHGNYLFDVNSDEATADQVIANGVTIRSRAKFRIADLAHGILRNAELYDTGDGIWSTTGSLTTARTAHTATLLSDGKVLVTGGADGNFFFGDSLASAELYDPTGGSWTDAGSLTSARAYHTATLLQNGMVLVAGGLAGGPLSSSELYDPASGTWTATGSLNTARWSHTATLLQNGMVLVAGGELSFGGFGTASSELYDPASGTWTATGSLDTQRFSHTATLLQSGMVLAAGGSNEIDPVLASAELYDPASGTWTATGNLHTGRWEHTATLLQDDMVLVAGGADATGITMTAELYDPANGRWIATGNLNTVHWGHTATLLQNGMVLVAGGYNLPISASAELYDPTSGIWAETGSLSTARYLHSATLLQNGLVLVAAGGGFGLPTGTVFTAINNTSAKPISGTFSNLPDGSTLTIGGKTCRVSYSGGDGNDLTLIVE